MLQARLGAAAAAAIIGAGVLAGCGSSGDNAGGSGHVTLQMWGFANLSQPLVTQYEKEHPDVTIDVKISDYDASHQTLTTALAAGKVPDLAQIAIDYMGEFVANPGTFTDLRKYGAGNLAGEFLDWRWKGGVAADGSVVGIPTDVGGMAVAYRTDLFASAGLPTDPAAVSALWPTWDGYIAAGHKYVQATGKKFVDSGKSVFRAESNQGGEKYTRADGSFIYETNPVIKQAWDDGTKAIAAGLSANLGTFTPQWNAALANSGVATVIAPAWMLSSIRQQAPTTKGKWNIATLPGTAGNDGGSFLAVPKRAAHPQQAYDFIKWLEAPANQLALFKENATFPSTPQLYTDPAVQGYTDPFFGSAPIGKIYTTSVQAVKPFSVGAKDRLIEQQFENAIYSVDQGKAAPDKAWRTALDGVKREVGG
jgi:cellobiose transport system substrate-binding protein